ncbi:hypothetical protein, partial [Paracidovorax anthurii]|uniref:hypothetical protein n=1 Tax=Paracidovorax anthurii TaxID=78229 RepID=UPI001B8651F7
CKRPMPCIGRLWPANAGLFNDPGVNLDQDGSLLVFSSDMALLFIFRGGVPTSAAIHRVSSSALSRRWGKRRNTLWR